MIFLQAVLKINYIEKSSPVLIDIEAEVGDAVGDKALLSLDSLKTSDTTPIF